MKKSTPQKSPAAKTATPKEALKPAAVTASATKTDKKIKRSTSTTEKTAVESAPAKKAKQVVAAKVKEDVPVVAAESEDEDEKGNSAEDDEVEAEEDDQTAALLRGFASSDEEDGSHDEGLDANTAVPSLPDDQQLRKKLESAANHTQDAGVIYIGRVPHGFYEHQMKAYFAQFGDIKRLRLSRNRRTGASKHYAFIEFGSSEVAQIVADTMDNYLMFGHLLKVRVVPKEQVRDDLFKGAGKRFKAVPWNKIERSRLNKTDRDGWDKRTKKEMQRRALKAEKLKALGYDYDTSELRTVAEVPVRTIEAAKEMPESDDTKFLTEAPSTETADTNGASAEVADISAEKPKTAVKKAKKGKQSPVTEEAKIEDIVEKAKTEAVKPAKVAKKTKKAKA